jgi:hypothetical protein
MANRYQEEAPIEAELARLLQEADQKQLVQLVLRLATRYPALLNDIIHELTRLREPEQVVEEEGAEIIDEEVTENWDFSGDELDSYPLARLILPPLSLQTYQERLVGYAARLEQGEATASVQRDLLEVLWEVELHAEQHDYHGALNLYALLLDTYLSSQRADLDRIFEYALNETFSTLEILLAEASSTLQIDASKQLSPFMQQSERQRWLERLFQLWLKYLQARHPVERITELLHTVAWHEDQPLLQTMITGKLEQYDVEPADTIVDFTRLYQIRMLERLLHNLL